MNALLSQYQGELERFLSYILPEQGAYIATWKRPDEREMKQQVLPTIAALATTVLSQSAQSLDTYFACSAYTGQATTWTDNTGRERHSQRTTPQITGVRCLWADLDVDPNDNRKYASTQDAYNALQAWLAQINFPQPTIVISGYGLHCYWRLDRVLAYYEWHQLAARFKHLIAQTGLKTDPTRTADGASVLRPPFTFNYKRQSQAPVIVHSYGPEIAVSTLLTFLPQIEVQQPGTPRQTDDAFSNVHEEVPSYAVEVAKSCKWVRIVGPELRGNVEEPVWYAMLGLLAYAHDGAQTAHAWSIGYYGYDVQETYQKLSQVAGRQTGPTTCQFFESKWADGCKGCPHRGAITTPLQLGRRTAEGKPVPVPTQLDIKLPEIDSTRLLHPPYSWTITGGLARTGKDTDDNPTLEQLHEYPMFIEQMRAGEVSRTAYAFMRHWSIHDGWQTVTLPAGDLTADGAFRTLGNQHVEIPPSRYRDMNNYFAFAKSEYKKHRPTKLQHETFGWKEDGSFLIGETLVVQGGHGRAGVSEELQRFSEKFTTKGTLSSWREAVQPLFRPGYEHQAFAVLASLAAPLMRFAPYPGTIYSVVHPHSGKGKTLGVEVATSIWGDKQSLWISHRDEKVTTGDTLKSQFRAMALFKSLPVIIDEMRESDPEKLRGLILAFTDGNPPAGLTREGVMRNKFGQWRTVMLATSNKSMVDTVTVNNDPAAAARIFEVTATLPPDAKASDGNAIRKLTQDNCGWAGIEFMSRLIDPAMIDWADSTIRQSVDDLTLELQSYRKEAQGGGDRYVASFLATTLAAAELANRFGLFQCDVAALRAWALTRWAAQRHQIDSSSKDGMENLSSFIREHWQNSIVVETDNEGKVGAVPVMELLRAPLAMRLDRNKGEMWVDRATLQRWCLPQNIHFNGFLEDLRALGVVLSDHARRNLGKGTKYQAVGTGHVVVIDAFNPLLSGELRDALRTPTADGPEGDPMSNVHPMRK